MRMQGENSPYLLDRLITKAWLVVAWVRDLREKDDRPEYQRGPGGLR